MTEDLPPKLKLTFVNRKRSTKVLEPPPQDSAVKKAIANAGSYLFFKIFGRFSANPDSSATEEKKPELVGELKTSKQEKKAVNKLAKMAETFSVSRDRCECRLAKITQQIKSTPRTDANKSKLIGLLKRRKQLQKQIQKIENAASSIDEYRYVVADAGIDRDIMSSVVELKKVVKSATKSSLGTSADKAAKKVGKAVDDLEDLRDDMAEMSDVLEGFHMGGGGMDDDDLLAEIDTWADDDDGDDDRRDGYPYGPGNNGASILVEEAVPPVLPPLPKLPSVPTNRPLLDPLPAVPETPVVKKRPSLPPRTYSEKKIPVPIENMTRKVEIQNV